MGRLLQNGKPVHMTDIVSESRKWGRCTVPFFISGASQKEVRTNPASGREVCQASSAVTSTAAQVLR